MNGRFKDLKRSLFCEGNKYRFGFVTFDEPIRPHEARDRVLKVATGFVHAGPKELSALGDWRIKYGWHATFFGLAQFIPQDREKTTGYEKGKPVVEVSQGLTISYLPEWGESAQDLYLPTWHVEPSFSSDDGNSSEGFPAGAKFLVVKLVK